MGNVLDLDARRATTEPKSVQLGGDTFALPARLPVAVITPLNAGDVEAAIRTLFGDNAQAAVNAGLAAEDIQDIATELYGFGTGESQASTAS